MAERLEILIQSLLEKEKEESRLNKQLKTFKLDPLILKAKIDVSSLQKQLNKLKLTVNVGSTANGQTVVGTNSESVDKLTRSYRTYNAEIQKTIASNRMQKYLLDNTKAAKKYGSEFDILGRKLLKVTNPAEMKAWKEEYTKLLTQISATGNAGLKPIDLLTQKIQKFSGWLLASGGVMFFITGLRTMIKNVVDLNGSLVELQKVSDLTGNSLESFTEKAFDLGEKIGRTGKDVIDAVTTFKRAGYNLKNSMGLAEAALVMTNVGDGIANVTDASSALIAVLRGFKLSDTDAMKIVDMINETSNTAAIDFQNITEGLRRVSGTLSQTGSSIEQTIGLLTGGFTQLRDIESVSSGLVMISQRLRGIDEDGQAIDGLTPKLLKDFKDIANIDIEDANGDLRSTYDILSDMARVFPSLTSEQRQYLGELAAGNVALCVAKVA